MSHIRHIPLFPLGTVLLPGNFLKLHIFESRYCALVKECLEKRQHFGVVYYTGEKFRHTGTTARIIDIPRTWPDGRMDIVCSGKERFEVMDMHEEKPYLCARIRYISDAHADGLDLAALKTRTITLLQSLAAGTGKPLDVNYLQQLDPVHLGYLLGNTDLLDQDGRQKLLEAGCPGQRLCIIMDAVHLSLQRMQATEKLQDIVGQELKIHHLFN